MSWLVSFLEYLFGRLPRAPLDPKPRSVSEEVSAGLTVHQKLRTAGLESEFQVAVRYRDEATMIRILESVHASPEEIRIAVSGLPFGRDEFY